MNRTPEVTTLEAVQQRSAYQSLEPVTRPSWWGVDLDPNRRPGVVSLRQAPRPFPNTRFPPERQSGTPASPLHGRTNKPMPPVFGTTLPPKGLAGAIRKFAARYPDHKPSYWLIRLASDRVELWEMRARRVLPIALPLALMAYAGRRWLGGNVADQGADVDFIADAAPDAGGAIGSS